MSRRKLNETTSLRRIGALRLAALKVNVSINLQVQFLNVYFVGCCGKLCCVYINIRGSAKTVIIRGLGIELLPLVIITTA